MAISNTAPQLFLSRQQTFTSSGIFIHPDGYSTPRLIRVQAWGAGGGGAAGSQKCNPYGQVGTASYYHFAPGGSGGNSGYYRDITFYISGNQTVVVGAGGAGGAANAAINSAGEAAGNAGTRGGSTTFGTWCVAAGGQGGVNYGPSYSGSSSPVAYGSTPWDGGSTGGMSTTSRGDNWSSGEGSSTIFNGSNFGNGMYIYSNSGSYYGSIGQLGALRYNNYANSFTSGFPQEAAAQYTIATNTSPLQRFMQRESDPYSPYIAPGGQAGGLAAIVTGSNATTASTNYTTNPPALGQVNYGMVGDAGKGGNSHYARDAATTGGTGLAATGYSAGGGGGGGAITYQTGFNVINGAGGAGAPGLLIVSY